MATFSSHDHSNAAFSWFTESCVLKNGIVPEWFHGVISRKTAEEKLISKPPGYFLIRVSESRVGYTLSYRGDDRCRHFMIDMLTDNQYVIIGEKKHHDSLHDLVAFHRKTPIAPYSQLLTVACEQADQTNYAELLFPQRKDVKTEQASRMNCSTQTQLPSHSNISTLTPPARPTSAAIGLYPCLETELSSSNLQNTDHPAKPVPKPRTICNISTTSIQDTPPQLPPRDCLPAHSQVIVEVDRSPGLMKTPPERHQISHNTTAEDKTQKHQQQPKPALKSLVNIKRKLKKKHSQSDSHTYEEIFAEPETVSALENVASSSRQAMENHCLTQHENCSTGPSHDVPEGTGRDLPLEYFNPPPFAPGY